MVVGECEDRQTTNRLLFRAPTELSCPLNKSDQTEMGLVTSGCYLYKVVNALTFTRVRARCDMFLYSYAYSCL